MTPRWAWIGVCLVLALFLSMAFLYPHQMVSPGNLIPAHAGLQQNCFACHAPFRGAVSERCVSCHAVADIGRRTTTGAPVVSPMPPFHQALTQQNCLACHTDHPRPMLTRNLIKPFDHGLLRADVRARCASCHSPPADDLHRGLDLPCGQCHVAGAWKPATFDHARYFSLSGPHNAACATCHVGGNYRTYTCYGCHEHSPARVAAEHREEGIVNIENCARCHRSADDEHGGRGEKAEGRNGEDGD